MKKIVIFLLLTIATTVDATVLLTGNGTSPATFSEMVISKAFDITTGTLYFGLDDAGASGGTSAISKVGRGTTKLTPIATNTTILSGKQIDFLALGQPTDGTAASYLAAVDNGTATQVIALSTDGTIVVQSSALNDANVVPATTAAVRAITASDTTIFAAVEPNAGTFGAVDSGIAVVTVTASTLALAQNEAESGSAVVRAKRLDPATTEMFITTTPTTFFDTITLHWDNVLQRLYTGLQLTAAGGGGDGVKSVVVGRLADNPAVLPNPNTLALDFANIAPDAAFAGGAGNNMVGVVGAGTSLAIKHIRTMHTSTGPSYLIINGSDGLAAAVGNLIFALPLVSDPAAAAATLGTLANKDSALNANNQFTTAATLLAHLPTSAEQAVQVGAGVLPLPATGNIADIVVAGDTVYVAINADQVATTEAGVFYSQALFDELGKVVRWTRWTKRALPFEAFPQIPTTTIAAANRGKIKFFDIDLTNGKMFAVEGHLGTTAITTDWDLGPQTSVGVLDPNSLVNQLRTALPECSSCVLDLDQSTRDFLGDGVLGRYALFGGVGKVAFAKTSSLLGGGPAQTVTSDFSLATNFLTTTLPAGAGLPTVLEYSRSTVAASNYFFAGTENGLFVFAATAGGAGFTAGAGVNDLNAAPFSTGSWQQAPNITGAVIDVKTSGRALYVLTINTSTAAAPLSSTLFRIPFLGTVATMFAPGNISTIAQSGVNAAPADLSGTTVFLGMQIIATGDPRIATSSDTEQLVLATNNGLFRSAAAQPVGVSAATTQVLAAWTPITAGNSTMFNVLAGIDTPTRHTVWPVSVADAFGTRTFEEANIHQTSGAGTPGTGAAAEFSGFVPTKFNSSEADPEFNILNGTTAFWSDGARRFLIVVRQEDPSTENKLQIIPFKTVKWPTGHPTPAVNDSVVAGIERFYWIKQIGATGILMVGTDDGVIGLE